MPEALIVVLRLTVIKVLGKGECVPYKCVLRGYSVLTNDEFWIDFLPHDLATDRKSIHRIDRSLINLLKS